MSVRANREELVQKGILPPETPNMLSSIPDDVSGESAHSFLPPFRKRWFEK